MRGPRHPVCGLGPAVAVSLLFVCGTATGGGEVNPLEAGLPELPPVPVWPEVPPPDGAGARDPFAGTFAGIVPAVPQAVRGTEKTPAGLRLAGVITRDGRRHLLIAVDHTVVRLAAGESAAGLTVLTLGPKQAELVERRRRPGGGWQLIRHRLRLPEPLR